MSNKPTTDHNLHAENEQLRAQLAQAERQNKLYRAIFDNSPYSMYSKDVEGRYLTCNPTAATALNRTVEQVIGATDYDVFPADVAAVIWESDRQIMETGEMVEKEVILDRPDGPHTYLANWFPLRDETGQIYGVCGATVDITERKQVEDMLRTFYALAENAPDGIFVSQLDNTVTYWNKAFCQMTGYSKDDLGLHAYELYAAEPEVLKPLTTQALEHGFWQGEIAYRCKYGQIFDAQLSIFTIRDDTDQPIALARIIHDLTDQQQAEKERAALQEQVIDAQRAALRELSTPLIPISERTVIMPLIGSIDSQRAQQVMETLLEGVAAHHANTVILDITGVQVVDTQVANTFIRSAQAVRLLGAQVLMTGIRPQIAQTLVQLGVDLSGINTYGSLQVGIAVALGHYRETKTAKTKTANGIYSQ
jgi:PAS domain S-box-containing protein